MFQREPGDFLCPAVMVQTEGLGVMFVLRRAFRGRHQIHPHHDARRVRLRQEQLQVVPVRGGVSDEPVIGVDAQLFQPGHHRVGIKKAIRAAEFGIVVGQVLPEESASRGLNRRLGLRHRRYACRAQETSP